MWSTSPQEETKDVSGRKRDRSFRCGVFESWEKWGVEDAVITVCFLYLELGSSDACSIEEAEKEEVDPSGKRSPDFECCKGRRII